MKKNISRLLNSCEAADAWVTMICPSGEAFKIVSGGQTGVDRAALDAALKAGIDCGGWCPAGRTAEDGAIPAHYPLTELAGAGYSERTRQNVADSDGTVIIYFGELKGGTELTLLYCITRQKPYLLIDASELSSERAGARLYRFVAEHRIGTLNVAGPRASASASVYDYTLKTIAVFLGRIAPGFTRSTR